MISDISTSHTLIYKADKIKMWSDYSQSHLEQNGPKSGKHQNSSSSWLILYLHRSLHSSLSYNSNEWDNRWSALQWGIHSPAIYYFCFGHEKKFDQGASVSHTKEGVPQPGAKVYRFYTSHYCVQTWKNVVVCGCLNSLYWILYYLNNSYYYRQLFSSHYFILFNLYIIIVIISITYAVFCTQLHCWMGFLMLHTNVDDTV